MLKKFREDFNKYKKYILYTTKVSLKTEIVGTYLSWLWLIIEPICFMLIYTFIAKYVFNKTGQYYICFVFIGQTFWKFFSASLSSSVKMVKNNRDIVTKVYVPKWVLLISKISVNAVKFLISFSLVIISMIICKVPISIHVLGFIPIIIAFFLFTFGICSIFMHFGIFIEDLSNITNIFLKMLFYLSGVFYSVNNILSGFWGKLVSKGNPVAVCINESRNVLLYSKMLNIKLIGFWFLVSIVLCIFGIRTIYKYENTYVKVMR